MKRIYLDHIAAAPLAPGVFEKMRPFLETDFGNPQSLHSDGQAAAEALAAAREHVSALIGADPGEVIFTASGTEANNLAIKGLAQAQRAKGNHILVSAIEHASVLNAVKTLEKSGFQTTIVPVDGEGRIDPADVVVALRKETVLVSVMTANSEVGTIEPVEDIVREVKAKAPGVLVHTDAVAAAGNVPLDVRALGVDALSFSGNAFYGPKGSAALFLKKGTKLVPQIEGGIQEGGRRGGTEDVAAIVGMGEAARLAAKAMPDRLVRMTALRDRLIEGLPRAVERVRLTGSPGRRLPYHASFCVEFVGGEAMLLSLDFKGIAASSFSACTSKSLKVSHVLLAMGLDHTLAQGSLIFSLIDSTAAADIDFLLDAFPPVVERLRKMSPLYTDFLKEQGR
ncbi:MAG: cysteine desulfurase family protein [Candidatus Aminicenantes bacterium]|nr:cysteine desulfurase family protein [Candidatus Aminicenantes bacterium]